jgi:3-deoxy-D-arabino-heptulosonate 7-phosphate (DAHP) synthase
MRQTHSGEVGGLRRRAYAKDEPVPDAKHLSIEKGMARTMTKRVGAPAEQAGNEVAGLSMGDRVPVRVIGGPCSVESLEQFREAALSVKAAEAVLLRGGS